MDVDPLYDITKSTIKKFVNDGLLTSTIKANNYPLMPIIKFISFDTSGHLQLMIGGKCPNCQANHLRNTCNIRYCEEVIDIHLKKKFKMFSHSSPLSTHDPNIEERIIGCGYRYSYPYDPNENRPFMELERFMLDFHPDLDTHVKMLSLKDQNDNPFLPNDIVTLNAIVTKYNFMFIMMAQSKIVATDGSILTGDTSIKNSSHLLYPGFTVEDNNGMTIILSTGRPQFNRNNYVVIV